jgi:small subunit ribosomal protein S13
LEEKEIKKLEDVIKNPEKYDVPDYILNLRKNPHTGKDEHFTGAELQIQTRKIIGDMKKLGSYVGIRHRKGLPVRGQRTRSSFRKSKSVGVSKKRQQPGKK